MTEFSGDWSLLWLDSDRRSLSFYAARDLVSFRFSLTPDWFVFEIWIRRVVATREVEVVWPCVCMIFRIQVFTTLSGSTHISPIQDAIPLKPLSDTPPNISLRTLSTSHRPEQTDTTPRRILIALTCLSVGGHAKRGVDGYDAEYGGQGRLVMSLASR